MTTNVTVGSPEWTDPDDAPVLTKEQSRDVEIYDGEVFVRRGRGRPKTGRAKELVSLRLDPGVLALLRTRGPGWQARVSMLLEIAIIEHPDVLGLDSQTVLRVLSESERGQQPADKSPTASTGRRSAA
jgi:uncharacterized protein (DUF4415 family)